MVQDFGKYFENKISMASFIESFDKTRKEDFMRYMDKTYREDFRSKLTFQTWMFRQEDLNQIAFTSFNSAASELFKPSKKSGKEKVFLGTHLFKLYKVLYLKQLFFTWAANRGSKQHTEVDLHPALIAHDANFDYQIKSAAVRGLNRMESRCRDYFKWEYIDEFTIEQIATITGKDIGSLRKDLWFCFQVTEQICNENLELPVQAQCTEEMYYSLQSYFHGLLSPDSETIFVNEINQDKIVQYYFQFFLALRYEIVDARVLDLVINQGKNDGLSAKDFLEVVKRKIEDPDK